MEHQANAKSEILHWLMRVGWFDWSPAWYVLTLETGDHNHQKGKQATGSGTDWQENGQGGGILPIFTQLLSSMVAGARQGSGPCITAAWVRGNVSSLLHLYYSVISKLNPMWWCLQWSWENRNGKTANLPRFLCMGWSIPSACTKTISKRSAWE